MAHKEIDSVAQELNDMPSYEWLELGFHTRFREIHPGTQAAGFMVEVAAEADRMADSYELDCFESAEQAELYKAIHHHARCRKDVMEALVGFVSIKLRLDEEVSKDPVKHFKDVVAVAHDYVGRDIEAGLFTGSLPARQLEVAQQLSDLLTLEAEQHASYRPLT